MYKGASDGHQRALHHGRPSDWIHGEERLTGQDKLNQLRQGIKILEGRILALPKGSEERKQLGIEKLAVQSEIKTLTATMPKAPPDWKQHFVNEAKRLLSDSQFKMIENSAKREATREQARNDAARIAHSAAGAIL
jgi:hypothetical protein